MNKATLNKRHCVTLAITWESIHHTEVLSYLCSDIDDAREYFSKMLERTMHNSQAVDFVKSAEVKPHKSSNLCVECDGGLHIVYAISTETIYNF